MLAQINWVMLAVRVVVSSLIAVLLVGLLVGAGWVAETLLAYAIWLESWSGTIGSFFLLALTLVVPVYLLLYKVLLRA